MTKKVKHLNRIPYTPPRGTRRQFAKPVVDLKAEAAANRMEKMGGGGRIQLQAAKQASGQSNLVYKPHQGRAERERRLAALTPPGSYAGALDLSKTPGNP